MNYAGFIYRKDKNKKLLFYVPRSMESNVIRTCHDDIGHIGVDKIVGNITKLIGSLICERKQRNISRIIYDALSFRRRVVKQKAFCIVFRKINCLLE